MKVNVKATGFDLTPSIGLYIDEKLASLGKFVKRLDAEGAAQMWIEVGKTTRHHHKGPVFRAEADLRLPKKILRAEQESYDLRTAIIAVRNKLLLEIEKYKTRFETDKRSIRRIRRK
ncbi:ribosome-associated translation inhibitor RaiA [Candidatus Parcubacteria bacterium]|nr:MAG: ribosome-associated translation inhibitor RaiA [Candidatus Parcubacteria bacterium]